MGGRKGKGKRGEIGKGGRAMTENFILCKQNGICSIIILLCRPPDRLMLEILSYIPCNLKVIIVLEWQKSN